MTARPGALAAREIPGARFVGAVAHLVPRPMRDDWRDEWLGEMAYFWARRGSSAGARLALHRRAAGALTDAFWIRVRHGGQHMLEQDLRFAIRSLARRPAFTVTVVPGAIRIMVPDTAKRER